MILSDEIDKGKRTGNYLRFLSDPLLSVQKPHTGLRLDTMARNVGRSNVSDWLLLLAPFFFSFFSYTASYYIF